MPSRSSSPIAVVPMNAATFFADMQKVTAHFSRDQEEQPVQWVPHKNTDKFAMDPMLRPEKESDGLVLGDGVHVPLGYRLATTPYAGAQAVWAAVYTTEQAVEAGDIIVPESVDDLLMLLEERYPSPDPRFTFVPPRKRLSYLNQVSVAAALFVKTKVTAEEAREMAKRHKAGVIVPRRLLGIRTYRYHLAVPLKEDGFYATQLDRFGGVCGSADALLCYDPEEATRLREAASRRQGRESAYIDHAHSFPKYLMEEHFQVVRKLLLREVPETAGLLIRIEYFGGRYCPKKEDYHQVILGLVAIARRWGVLGKIRESKPYLLVLRKLQDRLANAQKGTDFTDYVKFVEAEIKRCKKGLRLLDHPAQA